MLPWGHLAFGYLLYSPTRQALTDDRVPGREVLVLAVATQLPDLIDKPLSWTFSVFPGGYGLAHSVFVAGPVGLAALAIAARRDRLGFGLALAIGYWSHLVGDVLAAAVLDNPYAVSRVLWPLVSLPSAHTSLSLFARFRYYLGESVALLEHTQDPLVVLLYFGPLLAAVTLWLADGAPIVRELHEWAVDPQ